MVLLRSPWLRAAGASRPVPAPPTSATSPQWTRAFANHPTPLNGPQDRFTKSTLQIPEFPSKSKGNPQTNHVLSYFMVGTVGLLTGVGAKNTVNGKSRSPTTPSYSDSSKVGLLIHVDCTDFLVNMSASADVLAQAKVELAIASIPEGKNVCRSLYNMHVRRL